MAAGVSTIRTMIGRGGPVAPATPIAGCLLQDRRSPAKDGPMDGRCGREAQGAAHVMGLTLTSLSSSEDRRREPYCYPQIGRFASATDAGR
jgi:hypothetical protein